MLDVEIALNNFFLSNVFLTYSTIIPPYFHTLIGLDIDTWYHPNHTYYGLTYNVHRVSHEHVHRVLEHYHVFVNYDQFQEYALLNVFYESM